MAKCHLDISHPNIYLHFLFLIFKLRKKKISGYSFSKFPFFFFDSSVWYAYSNQAGQQVNQNQQNSVLPAKQGTQVALFLRCVYLNLYSFLKTYYMNISHISTFLFHLFKLRKKKKLSFIKLKDVIDSGTSFICAFVYALGG